MLILVSRQKQLLILKFVSQYLKYRLYLEIFTGYVIEWVKFISTKQSNFICIPRNKVRAKNGKSNLFYYIDLKQSDKGCCLIFITKTPGWIIKHGV